MQHNVLKGSKNKQEQIWVARKEKEKERAVVETEFITPISKLNDSKGEDGTSMNRGGSNFPRKILTRMLRNDGSHGDVTQGGMAFLEAVTNSIHKARRGIAGHLEGFEMGESSKPNSDHG